jgi:hypothetical protein
LHDAITYQILLTYLIDRKPLFSDTSHFAYPKYASLYEDYEDDDEEEEQEAEDNEDSEESDNSFVQRDRKKKGSVTKSKTKPAQKKSSKSSSSGVAVTAKARQTEKKPVPYDAVSVPMGDKTSIDKLLSWRSDESGENEELLVKYKVCTLIIYIRPRATVAINSS